MRYKGINWSTRLGMVQQRRQQRTQLKNLVIAEALHWRDFDDIPSRGNYIITNAIAEGRLIYIEPLENCCASLPDDGVLRHKTDLPCQWPPIL